jgi:hypothetical protein
VWRLISIILQPSHIRRRQLAARGDDQILAHLCFLREARFKCAAAQFDYKIGPEGHLIQTQIDDSERREELWKEDLRWVDLMYQDFAAA